MGTIKKSITIIEESNSFNEFELSAIVGGFGPTKGLCNPYTCDDKCCDDNTCSFTCGFSCHGNTCTIDTCTPYKDI